MSDVATTQTGVTVVDQSVAFYDDAVPQPLISAYSWTLMFAQAAARAVNPDPTSPAYFDAMTKELATIGWNVTDAGTVKYDQKAEKISPAGVVASILDPYLSGQQQKELSGILDVIKQPDAGVHNFVDFFWNHAHTSANRANMAFGPLTEVNNASNITLIYYGFNFDASSKRSLFVEVDSASLNVQARNLTMNLNMGEWDAIKSDLIGRLSGKVDQHVLNDKIDI